MLPSVNEVISEYMAAYKAGSCAFESRKAMPSGYAKHEQDCFKMGFNAAKNGTLYPSTKRDLEAVEQEIAAYSEGCNS